MAVSSRRSVTQRIGVRIRDAGVAEADFFTTSESRVDRRVERGDGSRVVDGQVDNGSVRRRR
jgi:hypothetical protein